MFDSAMIRRRRRTEAPPTLNLNSMMDMLSIILVFLLSNISADEKEFVLAGNLTLPQSTSTEGFVEAVQVKVSRQELLVNDTFVARMDQGHISGARIDGKKIVPLYNMLQRHRALDTARTKRTVIMQADRTFSFEVIDQVMRTAAMAGYPNFRLAIQKK